MMPASLGASPPDIAAGIVHDVGLGRHRTGSPGDLATSDWIAARRAQAGYRGDRVPIGVETLTTADATLMIDGAPGACAPHSAPAAIDGEVAGPLARIAARAAADARAVMACVATPGAAAVVVAGRQSREALRGAAARGASARSPSGRCAGRCGRMPAQRQAPEGL